MKDLFRCAWRELGRRPRRTLATTAGFVLAMFLLFIMGTLLGSARQQMSDVLSNVGTHIVVCVPATREEIKAGPASGPWPLDSLNEAFYADPNVVTRLLSRSVAAEIASLPAILDVAPLLLYRVKNPESRFLFSIAGFEPGDRISVATNLAAERDIIRGTFLRAGDRGVAAVEEGYAITAGLEVGSTVRVSGIAFPVIGIVKPGIKPGKADVYLTLEDARAVIEPRLSEPIGDRVNAFLVEVRHGRQLDEAIAQLRALLPGSLVNTFFCSVSAVTVLGMHEGAALLLMVIILVGVTLYALSSQWASVVERRTDIGILKAIGWSDRQVVGQLGLEGALQGLLGGVLGGGAGCLVLVTAPMGAWVGGAFYWNGFQAAILFLACLVVSLGSGLIAGVVPALLVARESPAITLRNP